MSRVTVDAPTKSRIDPKLGTDSAMKRRQRTENVLKAHRFQLKSEDSPMFVGFRGKKSYLKGH